MRLAVLTNVLAPYRIPLFEALARRTRAFRVFTMTRGHAHRLWSIPKHSFDTELLAGHAVGTHSSGEPVHLNFGVAGSIRRFMPDALLSGGFGATNANAYLASRGRYTFASWGELTLDDPAGRSLICRHLRRWTIRGSEACIASSSEARDAFLHYGAREERVTLSLMPVDVEFFHAAADAHRGSNAWREARRRYQAPVLLAVSQLIDRKGFAELWPAYDALLARVPSATLLIAGDGPGRHEYESHVAGRGWNRVHFLGFQAPDDLARLFAVADLFVFPTRHDPFGAVLSEAMAAGTPVVSSVHAAATRDLVEDGVTGFAIEPRDTGAFCGAIERALGMSALDQERMIAKARSVVMPHTFEAAAASIIAALQSARERPTSVSPRVSPEITV
jgi:glycosyltransferase involved in cell wall biosynthesis